MPRPRKNNADYFPHDTGMRKDGRITVLRSEFGLEGYAIFCMTLELLADSENFTVSLDEVELHIIAADFGVSPDKLLEIWRRAAHLRLIELSDTQIYCHKLVDRLQPLLDERERQRNKAQRRWDKEGKAEPVESFTGVKPRENNAGGMQSKVKKSKAKERKGNTLSLTTNGIIDGVIHPDWKTDFNVYLEELRTAYKQLINDKKWISEREKLNPGIDIILSIEKSCVEYWATEEGWINKKKSKVNTINWGTTLAKAISQPMNRVYKDRFPEKHSVKQNIEPIEPAI